MSQPPHNPWRLVPNAAEAIVALRLHARDFHSSPQTLQQRAKDGGKTGTKPRAEATDGIKTEATEGHSSGEEARGQGQQEKDGKKEEDGEEKKEDDRDGKKEKEDAAPPPPHGDKTPWQVFMDTMNAEFKQSKEWNESTKAIASSAHQFTESESVRRARQAYEATSGAVSSTASTVVKTTAGAIGKGASWTWETPVMKGVRKGANITGEALDKATKPIRETEVYKNVKNVIDDGSSKYGGWVEKEERRKQREARERMEGKKPTQEVHEGDPA